MTAPTLERAPLAFDVNAAIDEVWIRAEATHARSWQKAPGPSDAGTCLRRVGFMYAGTGPSDDADLSSPAATLGTWIHDRFLPLLQDVLGGEIEFETNTGGVIGHGDWAGLRAVIDLKTKAESALSRLRRQGASPRQLWQAHLYAASKIAQGEQIDYVIIVFIARDTGNHYAVPYAYDPAITAQAEAWFAKARTSEDPDDLPRGGRGPNVGDLMCDGCVWLTRCWPNDQTTILDEAPDRVAAIEAAAVMHEEASDQESEAKKQKQFAAAMVAAEADGEYGSFKVTSQSSGERLNQKRAKELLIRVGVNPPMDPPSFSPRFRRLKGKKGVGAPLKASPVGGE